MTLPQLRSVSDTAPASPGGPVAADVVMAQAEALLGAFGSPLYVVSEAALRESTRAFARGFAPSGITPRIAYSYKTNYLPAVCAILHQEGATAEVVSGMEYSFARTLGVPAGDIIFNGPGKTRGELSAAHSDGALVVVDGFDELDAVISIAAQAGSGRPFRIGLRIDLSETGWSRFGFRHDGGDARRALERVAAAPGLSLELLHHHAGTDHRDPAPYLRATRALCRIRQEAETLGLSIPALDLGGGFPANLSSAPFAAAIAQGLKQSPGAAPQIVVEPGRALIDPAMWLVCTVTATKEIPGLGRTAVVDAGINMLPPACRSAPRPMAAVRPARGAPAPTSVFGPLCMPEDRLAERAALPQLRPGDPLVIGEAGAYTLTQSTQFSAPRPAVVLLGPGGAEIVRRREDWRDVIAPCALPERLDAAHKERA